MLMGTLVQESIEELPWFCEMNMDKLYKSCDVVEQDWPEEEGEEEEEWFS